MRTGLGFTSLLTPRRAEPARCRPDESLQNLLVAAPKHRWIWPALALLLGNLCLPAASPIKPFMPRAEDFTLLWWANGPERFHSMKSPPT